jgi:hypothetical protein
MNEKNDTQSIPPGDEVPTLEEVAIPGELLVGEPAVAAEHLVETGRGLDELVDRLVDQAVEDALQRVAAGMRESLYAQLTAVLPELIRAAETPHEPTKTTARGPSKR